MSDRELETCKKCNSLHEGNGDLCGICQDGIIERLEKEVEAGRRLWIDTQTACKKHALRADGLERVVESLKMTMLIHAGDICSANNEADHFIDMNKDLEDEITWLRETLHQCDQQGRNRRN